MVGKLFVPLVSRAGFAAVAREWLGEAVPRLFPEWEAGLRSCPVAGPKPVVRPTGRERPPRDAGPPWGGPGQVFGEMKMCPTDPVFRCRETLYTEAAWREFLAGLEAAPCRASVTVGALDERGYPPAGDFGWVDAERERGWAKLTMVGPAQSTGWPGSAERQEAWAGYLREVADRVGACGGFMTDDSLALFTTLQYATGRGDVHFTDSRKVLVGYSWVTVVAPRLAGRLGGAAALRESGAFYEVSTLRNGGLWLRATPVINEFTGDRIRRVFEALAPVLIAGPAVMKRAGEEFRIAEGVDAADWQQAASPAE